MSYRPSLLCTVVATIALMPLSTLAQDNWRAPRTATGHPDLSGVWANNRATPLERPEQLTGIPRFSDDQVVLLTQAIEVFHDNEQAGDLLGDRLIQQALGNPEFRDYDVITGNYNSFWLEPRYLGRDNRTSLIVDPPAGRIPPLTDGAAARLAARQAYQAQHPADGPEARSLSNRCLHFDAPQIAAGYNSYFQIFQTPTHVAILQEMGHITRMIPIDDSPHIDDSIRQWAGNSRGWWEEDTLVVETTHYSSRAQFRDATANLHLVERLRRIGPEILQHTVTFSDPDTWTQPWTIELLHTASEVPIFEYACHEGNYAMFGILAGARIAEAADAATAAKIDRGRR